MTKLAIVELKLLTREPGAMFSLLIPLFILVVFGSSIEQGDTVLLPMALAIAVGLVGLYLLPTTMATYRERGILRRLATTPVRPGNLLLVQVLLQFVLALTACALLLAVAGTVLGAHLPTRALPGLLTFLFGTAAMFAVGLLIAAVAPNGRAANGIGVLLYFPMAYLAGLIQPTDQMPVIVARIGEYTPLGAFRQSLQAVWADGAPSPLLVGVLAAYAVVVSTAAAKFFRWE
ncbi:ABC transporter permease [Micromonospora sp. NPDC005806]|uniref:ABC transporter permease n=1 Tax=Micromonospora sp. NPDC005806 TaxID=3364234 RepID=UPI00368B3D22